MDFYCFVFFTKIYFGNNTFLFIFINYSKQKKTVMENCSIKAVSNIYWKGAFTRSHVAYFASEHNASSIAANCEASLARRHVPAAKL